MNFKLHSNYQPSGDQPEAIDELTKGVLRGDQAQTLLGVTGSGKTFTVANVIANLNRPTLVLSHNKTLAAQLYGEFKEFFPENAVEYFVSYYDYYQPEAYLPSTNTYIEKDLSINENIEKLRLAATTALLSGRKDIIIVASVSCIYGIGNPEEFKNSVIHIKVGETLAHRRLLTLLQEALYSRNELQFGRGNFRVKGDTIDVFPAYLDIAYRIIFWDDEIESIEIIAPEDGRSLNALDEVNIYPATIFVTGQSTINQAIEEITLDLGERIQYFQDLGRPLEAKRLEERVVYDVEMIKELGYCSGVENYSRYFDRRKPGDRPFCLFDYFPDDSLLVIDESHVTIPQLKAMYAGDRKRKENLVEYGFRLPSALDNRPLRFQEFEALTPQTIYISATPADYELQRSGGVVVEQVVRPTGLLDPPIEVRPAVNEVDDLLNEIEQVVAKKQRVLVTTVTKKMAEDLAAYMHRLDVQAKYIHSDVETLERVEIIQGLREGDFDVLIGVNLLREGLDLPEVALVAILDADTEGFLRDARSLTQTAGRAARNLEGKVIFYANKITQAMQQTIDETNRRREKQIRYNQAHGITPKQITKAVETSSLLQGKKSEKYVETPIVQLAAAEENEKYMSNVELTKRIAETKKSMEAAVKDLDFEAAARYRDEMKRLQKLVKS